MGGLAVEQLRGNNIRESDNFTPVREHSNAGRISEYNLRSKPNKFLDSKEDNDMGSFEFQLNVPRKNSLSTLSNISQASSRRLQ